MPNTSLPMHRNHLTICEFCDVGEYGEMGKSGALNNVVIPVHLATLFNLVMLANMVNCVNLSILVNCESEEFCVSGLVIRQI